jgi:hypothetical protein
MILQDAGATNEFVRYGNTKTEADEAGILLRLNYGLVATKVKPVRITEGYFEHTFHLELPNYVRPYSGGRSNCEADCQRLDGSNVFIATESLTRTMESVVARTIQHIYALLPDHDMRPGRRNSTYPRRRLARGLVNVVGTINHYLGGRQLMKKLTNYAQK